MNPFVDALTRKLDDRINEIRADIERLEAARSALTAVNRSPHPQRPAARQFTESSLTKPTRRRQRGSRAEQAAAFVSKHPGSTITEIAAALEMTPNYLYRVLPPLAADGLINRDGKSWYPV